VPAGSRVGVAAFGQRLRRAADWAMTTMAKRPPTDVLRRCCADTRVQLVLAIFECVEIVDASGPALDARQGDLTERRADLCMWLRTRIKETAPQVLATG
jgi:hypothetical protein